MWAARSLHECRSCAPPRHARLLLSCCCCCCCCAVQIYFETAREAYEAYVIYSFYMLLIHFLGPKDALETTLRAKGEAAHHLVPMCCLPRWKLPRNFLYNTSFGVLQ